MIRAKRLEWNWNGQNAFFSYLHKHSFAYGVEQTITREWRAVAVHFYRERLGEHFPDADSAKAACQAHADALAREIAEVGE